MSLLYIALGDSLTKGYGVGMRNAFPSLYATWLNNRKDQCIDYKNLGINGLTSGNLLNLIYTSEVSSLLSGADVVSLTIGSNDLLRAARGMAGGKKADIPFILSNLKSNLLNIGSRIRSCNQKGTIQIAGLYNPFIVGPLAPYAVSVQPVLNQANQIIGEVCQRFGFLYVPVNCFFAGKELWAISQDNVHPSYKGHLIMAKGFIHSYCTSTHKEEIPWIVKTTR